MSDQKTFEVKAPCWYVRNPQTSDILFTTTKVSTALTIFANRLDAENALKNLEDGFVVVEIANMPSLLAFLEFMRKEGDQEFGLFNAGKVRYFSVAAAIVAVSITLEN